MTTTGPHVLVVGAGLAGLSTVEALRSAGHVGRLTLVGDEELPPYDRPPLSKSALTPGSTFDGVRLRTEEELAGLNVSLRLGVRATELDADAHLVRLAGGDEIAYDVVVLATGSRARTPPGTPELDGIHVLRTWDDALGLRDDLARGGPVVVVGGGFVGAEVASAARGLGLPVTLVDPLPVLMTRGLGSVLGAAMTRAHVRHGVDLRLESSVAHYDGSTRVSAVVLTDGSHVPAATVVLGVGAAPAVDWLEGSGAHLGDGVGCDGYLRVIGVPDAYAVGDIARWPHPDHGSVRLEHWSAAVAQAQAVAATVTGTPTVCAPVPYVWTEQYGRILQVYGRIRPEDELMVVEGDLDGDAFVVLAGGDGRLQGVAGVGAPRVVNRYRRLLPGAAWPGVLAT